MPQTDAERKASLKWRKLSRKQITLDYKKDEFDKINAYCAKMGSATATYIKALLCDDMSAHERDGITIDQLPDVVGSQQDNTDDD